MDKKLIVFILFCIILVLGFLFIGINKKNTVEEKIDLYSSIVYNETVNENIVENIIAENAIENTIENESENRVSNSVRNSVKNTTNSTRRGR